jgi:hypothetical protein
MSEMEVPMAGDAFALRVLQFTYLDGRVEDVEVSIEKPVLADTQDYWLCPYRIKGPGFEKRHMSAGEDSLQALLLTLRILPVELAVLAKREGGVFSLYGELDLGFHGVTGFPT